MNFLVLCSPMVITSYIYTDTYNLPIFLINDLYTLHQLDGQRTLAENIADAGGLAAGYRVCIMFLIQLSGCICKVIVINHKLRKVSQEDFVHKITWFCVPVP